MVKDTKLGQNYVSGEITGFDKLDQLGVSVKVRGSDRSAIKISR